MAIEIVDLPNESGGFPYLCRRSPEGSTSHFLGCVCSPASFSQIAEKSPVSVNLPPAHLTTSPAATIHKHVPKPRVIAHQETNTRLMINCCIYICISIYIYIYMYV